MKYYKLKKDLPTFKAGEKFRLEDGSLYYYKSDNNEDAGLIKLWLTTIHNTLDKFPNILKDWFEEIEEEWKPWKPEKNEWYYYFSVSGLGDEKWIGDKIDEGRYAIGDCFKTEEESEKAFEWLKAFKVLRDDAKGYKFKKGNYNFVVCYSSTDDSFDIYIKRDDQASIIYFATEEDAEESIKKHEKEWRIFLGVEE